MIVSRRLAGIVVATVALVAACSGSGTAATTPPAATAPPAASPAVSSAPAGGVTIGVATSATLGQILTGPNGMTLYVHAGDTATSSACTGGCATAWPPLILTAGQQVSLASGLSGTVASFARSDGMGTQVTFNGQPLYYWQGDKAPGDTTGQNVNGFTVATPSGAGGGSPAATPTYNSGY